MSFTGSPTNINLNDTDPPAKPDSNNVEWQAGIAVFDSATGQWIRPASACYRTPQVGGIVVVTADYDLGDVDSGWTLVCNSASPLTITHPSAIPSLPNPQGIWNFKLINLGAGTVTLDLNGLNLDGSGTNPDYLTGEGAEISTDGTDLYTCLSSGTGGGGGSGTLAGDSDVAISSPANRDLLVYHSSDSKWHNDTQESLNYAVDTGTANAYAVSLSLAPALSAGARVVFKAANANTGASTLAVNGGSAKNIYKKTNANLVSGDILANQIIEVVYDGTNFQLTGNGATGSSPVVIGFVINNGAVGNNIGPMLQPPRAGQITKCAIVTKSSDATTGLTFRIKQNGVDIFSADPTVAAGTSAGTTSSSTSLTSNPLSVAVSDVFQIDITSGSSNWAFTAQLES